MQISYFTFKQNSQFSFLNSQLKVLTLHEIKNKIYATVKSNHLPLSDDNSAVRVSRSSKMRARSRFPRRTNARPTPQCIGRIGHIGRICFIRPVFPYSSYSLYPTYPTFSSSFVLSDLFVLFVLFDLSEKKIHIFYPQKTPPAFVKSEAFCLSCTVCRMPLRSKAPYQHGLPN